jgi:predicted nucleic acid-binding protein
VRFLLDTNMVSDLVRNPRGRATDHIARVGEEQVGTSIIVAAELRYGAAKKGSSRLSAQLEKILDTIPMIERPILQHARVALGKAERFAELSHGTPDDRFEGVIHGAYYAMFHAARAALLAVEGSATTNHGRVVETFGRMVKRRRLSGGGGHAAALEAAFELRMKADY